MSENLNTHKPSKVKDDLVIRAARFGAFGWVAFFLLLALFIFQNVVLILSPKQVLATVDGKVVGQVIFDEARIRSQEDIIIDVKTWVQHCTSVNKNTIYEDLAICLSHMEETLATSRLEDWETQNYVPRIANSGCNKTNIEFNDEATVIERDHLGYGATVQVAGEVICISDSGDVVSQEFVSKVTLGLIPRDTNYPLGIKVVNYED